MTDILNQIADVVLRNRQLEARVEALLRANNGLVELNRELRKSVSYYVAELNLAEIDRLKEGVREAAALFREYEEHHRAKAEVAGTLSKPRFDALGKARRNDQMAAKLEALLQ